MVEEMVEAYLPGWEGFQGLRWILWDGDGLDGSDGDGDGDVGAGRIKGYLRRWKFLGGLDHSISHHPPSFSPSTSSLVSMI